jgi:uncharacterized protein
MVSASSSFVPGSVRAAAGWYGDPIASAQLRYWDGAAWTEHIAPLPVITYATRLVGSKLDAAVYEMRVDDDTEWGLRPVLLPIAAFLAVICAAPIIAAVVNPRTHDARLAFAVIASFGAEAVVGVVAWLAGRDIAARYGGWGRAFGWRRPRWVDLGLGAAAFFAVLIGEIIVGATANGLSHGHASHEAQNLQLHTASALVVAVLFALVVVCAPLTEELVFRGLLLRTFMRRLTFWPAALLSTVIFALFHTYEVQTVAGAATLALTVACLGIANCVLNRYTDRLAAGIGVHAACNLLALVLVLTVSSH